MLSKSELEAAANCAVTCCKYCSNYIRGKLIVARCTEAAAQTALDLLENEAAYVETINIFAEEIKSLKVELSLWQTEHRGGENI